MKEEIDKRWRDLGEFIREQRNVGQLSLRKLSELAGVSNPYLSQSEHGFTLPSVTVISALAGALQVSADTLLLRAAGLAAGPGAAGRDPAQPPLECAAPA